MALADNMKQELAGIKPSEILAFNEEISQIPDVIKLTLGEPDFNTPEHVKSAAIKSIEENHSHYAPSSGIPPCVKRQQTFWLTNTMPITILALKLSSQWVPLVVSTQP